MSGRHSGGTSGGLRISALPRTLKLIFKLAPRQLNDEIALAKVEIKRKGIEFGVAAAFLAVALIFAAFLVVGLIVAAIMGLATIMPAWLAALLLCGIFLHPAGHTRVPRYVRGKRGVVIKVAPAFSFPDAAAHGQGHRNEHTYHVEFSARELWADAAGSNDSVRNPCAMVPP